MTNNAEVTQAVKDIQESQKCNQTVLSILAKYQELSKLIQQASAVCASDSASKNDNASVQKNKEPPFNPHPETEKSVNPPGNALNFESMMSTNQKTVKRERPILFPKEQDFHKMYKTFKSACKNVHKKYGPWADVKSMSSFNNLGYDDDRLDMKTLFNMLWFVSAAITQNLSHDFWHVDEDMEPLIGAINMLNSLEFKN